jgi:hypothetical protein
MIYLYIQLKQNTTARSVWRSDGWFLLSVLCSDQQLHLFWIKDLKLEKSGCSLPTSFMSRGSGRFNSPGSMSKAKQLTGLLYYFYRIKFFNEDTRQVRERRMSYLRIWCCHSTVWFIKLQAVLGIHGILVRIRIQLWIQLLSSVTLRMPKFCVKFLFCKQSFSSLNTFMRKGKDFDPQHWLPAMELFQVSL